MNGNSSYIMPMVRWLVLCNVCDNSEIPITIIERNCLLYKILYQMKRCKELCMYLEQNLHFLIFLLSTKLTKILFSFEKHFLYHEYHECRELNLKMSNKTPLFKDRGYRAFSFVYLSFSTFYCF